MQAFTIDHWAASYFHHFPKLVDLNVTKVAVLPHGAKRNFEEILDLMLHSKQVDFLIDVHGNEVGVYIPLAPGAKLHTTKITLFMLMALDRILRHKPSGHDVDEWKKLLQEIEQCNRMLVEMSKRVPTRKGEEGPIINITWWYDRGKMDSDGALDYARSQTNVWCEGMLKGLELNRHKFDELVGKMRQIRQKGLKRVEFRSCKIGKDAEALSVFREFFDADTVGGPDVRSGFAELNPLPHNANIHPNHVDSVLREPGAQLFQKAPGERFVIALTIAESPHTQITAHWAADFWDAVRWWIATCLMFGSSFRHGSFPIHLLGTEPKAVFPENPQYRAHIKYKHR